MRSNYPLTVVLVVYPRQQEAIKVRGYVSSLVPSLFERRATKNNCNVIVFLYVYTVYRC